MNESCDLAQSFGDVLAHSVGAQKQFARLFIQLDRAVQFNLQAWMTSRFLN